MDSISLMKRLPTLLLASSEQLLFMYNVFEHSKADTSSLVAVHGLGGHWEDTWKADNGRLWLRDFLPLQLHERNITARIMSYGYNATTAFSKSVADITDEAVMLLSALKSERTSDSERNRPIIFIAHSLGGIIVKKVELFSYESLHSR